MHLGDVRRPCYGREIGLFLCNTPIKHYSIALDIITLSTEYSLSLSFSLSSTTEPHVWLLAHDVRLGTHTIPLLSRPYSRTHCHRLQMYSWNIDAMLDDRSYSIFFEDIDFIILQQRLNQNRFVTVYSISGCSKISSDVYQSEIITGVGNIPE